MLINGIELSALNAILYDRILSTNTVETAEEWLSGAIQPTYVRQQEKFKDITLKFLVLGTDENAAYMTISKLTHELKKPSIVFDDMPSLTFNMTLQGKAEEERLKNGNFVVSYRLKGDYAQGIRQIYTTDATATNSFKLTVMYYQNNTTLLATDTVVIKANSFIDWDGSLLALGINPDKYRPEYYSPGVARNISPNTPLDYDTLQSLQVLVINYAPTAYKFDVYYFMEQDEGSYSDLVHSQVAVTYPQIQNVINIGQIIDAGAYKPEGYKATINYTGEITIENLLAASPIYVYYNKIAVEKTKNITVNYYEEDDGVNAFITSSVIPCRESQFIDGMTISQIININAYKPQSGYYNDGYIEDHPKDELIFFDSLQDVYNVYYTLATNTIYVEYYVGVYPNWYRLTSITVPTKYNSAFDTDFDVQSSLNIDFNKYHTAEYEEGLLFNGDSYKTYNDVLSAGVLQVFYRPLEYSLTVNYYLTGDLTVEPVVETVQVTALDFMNGPVLNDIIPITAHRPEGYQFDSDLSYNGEVSLNAMLQAAPIRIVYSEIEEVRTKNIIVRYKQELASAYSTINTSLITINEADVAGGVRLKDIIPLNTYKPEYYEDGLIDGASSTALMTYEELESSYTVIYMATSYTTPVRYYFNTVEQGSWIGSSYISYRIIDFTVDSTLYDFGLNLNQYKPSYTLDGVLQYNGPVNFSALRELESIDVLYPKDESVEEPDEDTIDYPHRFLFLQHNDLGEYESLHPTWTMNHAFINTGVSVDDMSKLTVEMRCKRADEYTPLHEVNSTYGYLFGSSNPTGHFYMRFHNQTQYTNNPTGADTYEAQAGLNVNPLILAEENAVGWSTNSGIYASSRDGYSFATFTYTRELQTEHARMSYPLYLFANNAGGGYANGLAGIGILGCKIRYDGQLLRDMIPVQFYDKIGDQVAPSNCLYDKVSKTFFEDGTGLNSFNIIDDDSYVDTNPEHKIGAFYVQYYKNDDLFQTSTIYFRASELTDTTNLYDLAKVDEFQPPYYSSGTILNLADFTIVNYESLNGAIIKVGYNALDNLIVVNYYKDSADDEANLLATERIPITERDFYQVPTFGDLVRLNKYKPAGYQTDFKYTGLKVSFTRVLDGSPYNIVYTPVTPPEAEYTTQIKYMKKVYGLRTYETIATETLTLKASDFRDGEYIDWYINFNKHKPAKYYGDGEPYQWYAHDERLDTPEDLKAEYVVYYLPTPQGVLINYYTDEVDEANLIAQAEWTIKLDDFSEPLINIVDELPNEWINKFKPVRCDGGKIQNPERNYTFDELVTEGIHIVYMSLEEPNDPAEAYYAKKVLYWTNSKSDDPFCTNETPTETPEGGKIPWIDLGYTPKEIKRLRVEIKCFAQGAGMESSSVNSYSQQMDDYAYFFGYRSPPSITIGYSPVLTPMRDVSGAKESGWMAIRPRLPYASSWVRTAFGPQDIDGQVYMAASDTVPRPRSIVYRYVGYEAGFRRGASTVYDDNYEVYHPYKDRTVSYRWTNPYYDQGGMRQFTADPDPSWNYYPKDKELRGFPYANPTTIILDAYNGYISAYDESSSNTPFTKIIDYSDENDNFEDRGHVRGSLTLFRTRNPYTGQVNIMPFDPKARPSFSNVGGSLALSGSSVGNPYEQGFDGTSIEIKVLVGTPVVDPITGADTGKIVYTEQFQHINVNYANFTWPACPQINSVFIWGLKIYDSDRLVRDLIPVAKGDKVYDYVMPENGLFDLVTEIFFGNSNVGGTYRWKDYLSPNWKPFSSNGIISIDDEITIEPEDVMPLQVMDDPCIFGKITQNYYDYDNSLITNEFVDVPTWFSATNTTIEDALQFNNYKPDDFHLDGFLDLDADLSFQNLTLKQIYEMGASNVYYKLRTFTKTVVYYRDNYRIGSQDIHYSFKEIDEAETLSDLGINIDLYKSDDYKPGRVVFNEEILRSDNIADFIDAPSPIVVYDKYTKEERPDLFYVEYYRGGAYDDNLITLDETNVNYLNCSLDGVVLNPHGAILYQNHYHTALYEDEPQDYFLPYVVRVINKYTGIHKGPAKRYPTLAMIVREDTLTIVEERNGWGRLKEYPKGWILLNATERVVGPGQNPDFDVPDDENAVLPFKTDVHITRLTVDRLWAYVEAKKSWVKSEDLSYNQSGKLYNALSIEVIHLDEIDWTNVSSLNDLKIYPELKRLRYHDMCGYTYEGEYTQAAFEALHELDFVYPETIYNYVCVYYKDNVTDANELGRSAFSCSISDWNPDWDVFISTNALYRDTDLTLNWDYFGFDRNLYRPSGYPDGLYLWNPRSWNDQDVFFSFEELVRMGSQKVLYAPFALKQYKAVSQVIPIGDPANYTEKLFQFEMGATDIEISGTSTSSWPIPYSNSKYFLYTADNGYGGTELDGLAVINGSYRRETSDKPDITHKLGILDFATQSHRQVTPGLGTNVTVHTTFFGRITYDLGTVVQSTSDADSYFVYNLSNLRDTTTSVFGIGDYKMTKPSKFYLPTIKLPDVSDLDWIEVKDDGFQVVCNGYQNDNGRPFMAYAWMKSLCNVDFDKLNKAIVPIEYNTNIKDRCILDLYDWLWTNKPSYTSTFATTYYYNEPLAIGSTIKGPSITNWTKQYNNFQLAHYWVPVPKGLWYRFNQEEKRFNRNGFYDLITGGFYAPDDGVSIYKFSDNIHAAQPYDYFDSWSYNKTLVDYIVRMKSDTTAYAQPDTLSKSKRSLYAGLIVPISAYTADSANHVIGEWNYSCETWFKSSLSESYAGDFTKSRLVKLETTVVLLNNDEGTIDFKGYLNPEDPSQTSPSGYGTVSAQKLKVYYEYTNASNAHYYFTGREWVPQNYTHNSTTALNKNYAVFVDALPYYSVPIALAENQLGSYLSGDRITILYTATNNPNWGFTGQGWIRIDENLNEVL